MIQSEKMLFSAGQTFSGAIKEEWDRADVGFLTVGGKDVNEWLSETILKNMGARMKEGKYGAMVGPEVVVEITIKVSQVGGWEYEYTGGLGTGR